MIKKGERFASAANLLKVVGRFSQWYTQIKFAGYLDAIETGKEAAGDAGQQEAGNNDTTAGGQQSTTQDAAGNQDNEAAGLKAAAVAERAKRQDLEAQNQSLQQQLQIANANAPQATTVQQPSSMFMQAAKQMGIDTDYMTPDDTGRVMDALMQYMAQNQQGIAFDASHSDFDEIVGKVIGGRFVESPHLQKVFEQNPDLRQAFKALGLTPSTKLIAYQMVKNSPDYQAAVKTEGMTEEQKKAAEAEATINAANNTASISSVQGGGNLDRGAALAGMDDAEFKVELDKKMAEA